MTYHVLCGWKDEVEFPISIFVERDGKDPVYICVSAEVDNTILEQEGNLHYKPYEDALVTWPLLEHLMDEAKKSGEL